MSDAQNDRADALLRVQLARRMQQTSACCCVGPQNGQPLCPCAMRGIIVRDGRYIQPEQDLGPVGMSDGTGSSMTSQANTPTVRLPDGRVNGGGA